MKGKTSLERIFFPHIRAFQGSGGGRGGWNEWVSNQLLSRRGAGTGSLLQAPQDFQSEERQLLSERSDSGVQFCTKPFLGTCTSKAGPPLSCAPKTWALETSPLHACSADPSGSRVRFQTTLQRSSQRSRTGSPRKGVHGAGGLRKHVGAVGTRREKGHGDGV